MLAEISLEEASSEVKLVLTITFVLQAHRLTKCASQNILFRKFDLSKSLKVVESHL